MAWLGLGFGLIWLDLDIRAIYSDDTLILAMTAITALTPMLFTAITAITAMAAIPRMELIGIRIPSSACCYRTFSVFLTIAMRKAQSNKEQKES